MQPVAPPGPPVLGEVIPLAPGRGRAMALSRAVMASLGAVAFALIILGAAVLLQLLFLFLSGPFSRAEWVFIFGLAAFAWIGGTVLAVLGYLPWLQPAALAIHDVHLELTYPAFRGRFVVHRDDVRIVAFDERPGLPAGIDGRFPVEGDVPGEFFKDALDHFPSPPWVPFDRSLPKLPSMRAEPTAHLFNAHGTALPFLLLDASLAPNIAVIFRTPQRLPKRSLAAATGRCMPTLYSGSRTVSGMLLRLSDTTRARARFAAWGVPSVISRKDLLALGLFLPKPLRGWRAGVFAALMLVGLLIRLLVRN